MSNKISFGKVFITIGLILQIIIFVLTNETWLSFISGCAGVISVVLCSEKKISMYTFGFIQLFTYIIICIQQSLYGEIVENLFYFITMIVGIMLWKKNYSIDDNRVVSKEIKRKYWVALIFGSIIVSFILGKVLNFTNDTQPYLDAFSTVPAFVAQILMILRYREQWYYWLAVDLLTCVLWINANDWCMVAQYVFWTINCFYGLKTWKTT